MNEQHLRIATRKSKLALWQANHIKTLLEAAHPNLTVTLHGMTTSGDRFQQGPLQELGGKRLFIKELELALMNNEADIAVHSLKDVPTDFPEELTIGAICQREDARDAFLSVRYQSIDELPPHANIGTSSLRRACQLKYYYPHLKITSLRGNVDTRIQKLQESLFDGIVLAAAGLHRLGLDHYIRTYLPLNTFTPAAGQGALAIECRSHDNATLELIRVLHHAPTATCVTAERIVNDILQGGCQLPVAAYAEIKAQQLTLTAMVGRPDGSELIRSTKQMDATWMEQIGREVADELLRQGANQILNDLSLKRS